MGGPSTNPSDRGTASDPAGRWEARAAAVRPWEPRLEFTAVGLVVLAAVVGSVVVFRSGWVPVEDTVWMELRIRDIPGHLPLNGVYSRFGGSHPGPAQFFVLWPLYELSARTSASLLAATLLLHLSALVLAWWVARRQDRGAGLAVLVVGQVLMLGVPLDALRSPWNPYVVLVGGLTVAVLAWGTSQGSALAATLVLPTGTMLVQAHLATAGLVAAALGAGLGCSLLGRAVGEAPVRWRNGAAGAAVAFLMWLPPLWSQIQGTEGRWSQLLEGASSGGDVAGAAAAIGLASRALAWWPSWADRGAGAEPFPPTSVVPPALLLVVVAGCWSAWRRRDRVLVRGLVVTGSSLVGATIAAAMMRGGVFGYLTLSVRTAAAALVAFALASLAAAVPRPGREVVYAGLAAIALVLAMAGVLRQFSAEVPWGPLGEGVQRLVRPVLDSPVPPEGYVLVPATDGAWVVGSEALMLQLERVGVDVLVRAPSSPTQLGPHRIDSGSGRRTELTVASADQAEALRRDGWQIVAEDRPLSSAERRTARDLEAQLGRLAMRAARGDRAAAIDQLVLTEQLKELLAGRDELVVAVREPNAAPR